MDSGPVPQSPAPVPTPPPVVAARVPQANAVPELVAHAGAAPTTPGTVTPGNAGTGAGAAGQAADDAADQAGTPPLITAVGSETAPAGTAAADAAPAPVATALDRLLAPGQVTLSSVVLGPTNTAVFRTPQGFVVVEQGQAVPGLNLDGTPVLLQEVKADAVVLAASNLVTSVKLEQR